MLGAQRDDVPTAVRMGLREAEDRKVVGLGRPGGEHDLLVGSADQRCDLSTRLRDALGGGGAEDMRRTGVAEIPFAREAMAHQLSHRRVHR